jgi:hypothetical protein
MEKIAWLFIYLSAFGITEFMLPKYLKDNELFFYTSLGFIGIFMVFYYREINSN